VSMTSSDFKSEVLRGPERRRRRTPAAKLAIVVETQEPGGGLLLDSPPFEEVVFGDEPLRLLRLIPEELVACDTRPRKL
jgi:hypothetical protein